MEGNLPFLLCLTLYLRAISKYKPPGGLYLERRFNGGFLALRVLGAYIWRGVYMEGLIFGILRYVLMEFSKTVPFYLTDMKLFPFLKLSEKFVFLPQYHTWVESCIFLVSPRNAAPPQEICLWCLQSHAAQTSGLPVCLEDVSDPLLTPKEKKTTWQIKKKWQFGYLLPVLESHRIAGG